MLGKLEHSIGGYESINLFRKTEFTVFIEGNNDFNFWKKLFQLADIKPNFEQVNGCSNLNDKIDSILNKKANFVVACDAHYDVLLNKATEHKQIIRTYGHSIENSLFTTSKINKIITIHNGIEADGEDYKERIDSWKKAFSERLTPILIYEIAKEYYNKNFQITHDSCQEFLKTKTSPEICEQTVSKRSNKFKSNFTKKEINTVRKILNESKKDNWFHFKGKLLNRVIRNIIKYYVKNIKITDKDLYLLFYDFDDKFQNEPDIKAVVRKIKKLKPIPSPTASQT